MSYLSLLDKSSLFNLLVRLHYDDLWNLCKVHNFLYKITCTPHFQESWTKYNLKECTFEYTQWEDYTGNIGVHTFVDRLNTYHGKTIVTIDGLVREKFEYVQGIIEGTRKVWINDSVVESTYVKGVKQGPEIATYINGVIQHTCYVNNVKTGLGTTYCDDLIILADNKDGEANGKCFRWCGDGILQSIHTFKDDVMHGRQIEHWADGSRKKDYTIIDGELHGEYLFWNKDGSIRIHSVHNMGIVVKQII